MTLTAEAIGRFVVVSPRRGYSLTNQ